MTLRRILTATFAVVAALIVVVSGALVLLSTILHATTISATSSVESVRLAQEAEIELLLHARAQDPLLHRAFEEDVRRRIVSARPYVRTDAEGVALSRAEAAVETYFEASRGAPPEDVAAAQQAAYVALEQLVSLNVEAARAAQDEAATWDRLANFIGLGVAALAVVVAATLAQWIRRSAFVPLLSLAATMQRFGGGDRAARAEESGAAELRDMSRRFNDMATAIAAQREAQMAFLGGVAHDLRNPLSVLSMAVQMLRPGQPLPDEPQLRKTIAMIERQLGRMLRMTGDFLDMTKIEAGQLELRAEPHDLRDVVRSAASLFEAPETRHQIEIALPEERIEVCGDPLRLEQVLINLVSNAMKYSPAGTRIEVALVADGDHAELRVTDEGAGISETDVARLFEPFRRVGAAPRTSPGLGLGLFVVKRIVEAHGGRIDVDSTLGCGSTFRVQLPRT